MKLKIKKNLKFSLIGLLLLFGVSLGVDKAQAWDSSIIATYQFGGGGNGYTATSTPVNMGTWGFSGDSSPISAPNAPCGVSPTYDNWRHDINSSFTAQTIYGGFTWSMDLANLTLGSGGRFIIDKGAENTRTLDFILSASGQHLVYSNSGGIAGSVTTNNEIDITWADWNKFTFVVDSSGVHIYVNGYLDIVYHFSGSFNFTTNNTLSYIYSYSTDFYASVQNFTLFNRPLTSDEVLATADSCFDSDFSFSFCGDGICNGTESFETCAADCLLEMTTLQDLYLQFNPSIFYCPINTTCKLNYNYDPDIFTPADFLKVYYYASSTAIAQYLGVEPIATSYQLGIYGKGYLTASSTATSTAFSYYQVVPCQMSGDCWGTSTLPIWYTATPSTAALISAINNFNATTTPAGIADLPMYNMACSDEEWNTPDPVWGIDWLNATTSIPALNFTKLKCYTLFTLYKTGDYLAKSGTVAAEAATAVLKVTFPFNIPLNIYASWVNSASSTIPTNIAWLSDEIDLDGNISINLGNNLTGIGTTSTTTIWGKDVGENITEWETWRLRVRTLFGYLIWGAFIYFQIIRRGYRIYDELNNKE